jgi:hypothetical protein
MAALPEPPADSRPPYWNFWRNNLWHMAQIEPAENFWHWPAVRHTMTVQHVPIGDQLAYLQQDRARWMPVVGDHHEHHSRNLIHQAYHLKVWEDTTGQRVDRLGTILEFGGGYGAMADLCRRLGFVGRYVIVDLPEFMLLQAYFLAGRGVVFEHVAEPIDCDLFIAVYSLSETDPAYRAQFLAHLDAASYLLLYSGRFAEYDNADWAQRLAAARPGYRWQDEQFPGRPDNYLIGWKP